MRYECRQFCPPWQLALSTPYMHHYYENITCQKDRVMKVVNSPGQPGTHGHLVILMTTVLQAPFHVICIVTNNFTFSNTNHHNEIPFHQTDNLIDINVNISENLTIDIYRNCCISVTNLILLPHLKSPNSSKIQSCCAICTRIVALSA